MNKVLFLLKKKKKKKIVIIINNNNNNNNKAIVGIRTLEKSGDRMRHLSRF